MKRVRKYKKGDELIYTGGFPRKQIVTVCNLIPMKETIQDFRNEEGFAPNEDLDFEYGVRWNNGYAQIVSESCLKKLTKKEYVLLKLENA